MGDRDDGRRIGFVFIILGILVWGIYIYIYIAIASKAIRNVTKLVWVFILSF